MTADDTRAVTHPVVTTSVFFFCFFSSPLQVPVTVGSVLVRSSEARVCVCLSGNKFLRTLHCPTGMHLRVYCVCAAFLDTSAVNSDPFHQSSAYIYFCPHTTSVTNNRRLQYQCWNSVNRAVQLRASALSSHVDTQGHNRHFKDFFFVLTHSFTLGL